MLNLSFKRLELSKCNLLHKWLQLAHVRIYWDDGDRNLIHVINHYMSLDETKRYLFYSSLEPIGYIQSYPINSTHQYFTMVDTNNRVIGIDFFIGNPEFLDKGHASIVIKEFISTYCNNYNIIVDPNLNNHKAIHIYEKIGFYKLSQFSHEGTSYQLMIKLNKTI